MDNSSSKSRSTAEKFRTPGSRSKYIDNDIEAERQYLEKLKIQRVKTEKLYTDYMALTKEREKLKNEKEDLSRELQQWKMKYRDDVESSKNELKRIQAQSSTHQLEIKRITLEKTKIAQELKTQYSKEVK